MPEEDVADTEVQAPPAVRPPVPLLVLAGASVALSTALLFMPGLMAHVAGYVLGSFVAIALVGTFRRNDLHRRQSAAYVALPALTRWAGAIVVVGVLVAALHTWWIATELAK